MRYSAEEYWTGLKTSSDQLEALLSLECWSESQLTSNPWRVRRLLTKLKELRVQAQHLDKNSAFRPAISQVKPLIEVPERNVLRSICWRIRFGHLNKAKPQNYYFFDKLDTDLEAVSDNKCLSVYVLVR